MNVVKLAASIGQGKSLTRSLMNEALREYEIRGTVVDVGGARSPDYFSYLVHTDVVSIEPVDAMISGIDFEKDRLPYADASVDTAILANVLEHIYNHTYLIGEIFRILRPGGTLIGFVPFLLGYHADPHDYFRYTPEALVKILSAAGFKEAKTGIVGGGPFYANCNNVILSLPRFLRPAVFLAYHALDRLFIAARPKSRERYALGYIFYGKK